MVTVGEILNGKVTGITKFGAFVSLPDGKSGLVHISEISNSYVSDIRSCLSDGQEVRVKVVSIDEKGRINLSIKRAEERPEPKPEYVPKARTEKSSAKSFTATFEAKPEAPVSDSFEDKLKAFMKASESKMSDIRSNSERKNSGRRRGR